MMESEQWLVRTMQSAIDNQYKIALLIGWRVRIYNRAGITKFTFELDNFTEDIQCKVVDMIFPYID